VNQDSTKIGKTKKKSVFRPVWITALFLTASVSLTFLLFRGIEHPSQFSTNILVLTLVNVNITLTIVLVLLLSRNLIKVYFERKREPGKSRFKSKLVGAFLGLSLIPSILLFIVASGLLTSSIENWFSIQVEKSLDQSLGVAQDYYEQNRQNVVRTSNEIGRSLLERNMVKSARNRVANFLERRREEHGVQAVHLFTPELRHIARASEKEYAASPPSPDFLEKILESNQNLKSGEKEPLPLSIQSTPKGDLIRGVIPLRSRNRIVAILVVDHLIPLDVVQKMEGIKKSVEEYKQLKAFKNPIKGSYILSFLIIVLLIIFSAVWFGIYFSRTITVPIQRLAEGTQAVAGGDLNFQLDVRATDELGVLVDSFNKMTSDLKQGQEKIKEVNRFLLVSNRESEGRRAYMEGVLQNIGAGVISVDEKGRIATFNPSASKIFSVPPNEAIQKDFIDFFLSRKMGGITDLYQQMQAAGEKSLEEEIIVEVQNRLLTLRITLSVLQGHDKRLLGFVIVFDDLTELIRAQKVATWQEVARRIAHEIKNPLTPIQLSTERLRKKYFQGSSDFDKIFDESTRIVINEVQGLKRLVDEFSEFARLPPPHRSVQTINPILQEVILLYQTSQKDIVVTSQFDEDIPMLNLDRDQIKRVFLNLFENAVEAMEGEGGVYIATAYDLAQQKVRIEVSDEGVGIEPDDLEKLFLPYFSRKKTGTGLGLAIVNRIVTDHNGQIRVAPRHPKGTTFTIEFPV